MNLLIIIVFSLIFLFVIFVLFMIQKLQKTTDKNLKILQEQLCQQSKQIEEIERIDKSLNKEIELKNNMNLNNLQDIKDIALFDNNVIFKKTDISKISKFKYIEVKLNGSLSSSISSPAILDTIIKGANPNGFYTATETFSKLMKYSDGTISSMVKGTKGIVKHSGFISSTFSVFAPIIILQALTIITGQIYLKRITKQLSNILDEIKNLQSFIESEDFAKINVIQDEIPILSEKDIISQQDFNIISTFRIELKIIKEKYRINLENEKEKIKNIEKNNIDKFQECQDKVNKYLSVFYICQELLFYCETLEFIFYIKKSDFQQAEYVYNIISEYNIEQLSIEPIVGKIEKLKIKVGKPWFNNDDKKLTKLNGEFAYLNYQFREQFKEIQQKIQNIKEDLDCKWNKSQEILYYIDEKNNQRLFIKDESDDFKDSK